MCYLWWSLLTADLHLMQAAKRQRDSNSEDDDASEEEEERPKMSNRAAAMAASNSRPAELVTSKRVLLFLALTLLRFLEPRVLTSNNVS